MAPTDSKRRYRQARAALKRMVQDQRETASKRTRGQAIAHAETLEQLERDLAALARTHQATAQASPVAAGIIQAVQNSPDAIVGAKQREGNRRGGLQNKAAEHGEWATYARQVLALNPTLRSSRGWKTRLAKCVAGKFNQESETVRKRLRKMNIFS